LITDASPQGGQGEKSFGRISMGHKITEAIIENGQIKHVTHKLPRGKLKVHLIYDAVEEMTEEIEVKKMVEETSGIYKDIDPGAESRKLRMNWERSARD
jgi:hypothetical protein